MTPIHRMAWASVFVLAVGSTASFASTLSLIRPARSGVPSLIAYERSWDRACTDTGATVSVTGEPSHGTITVEQGTSTIPPTTPRFGSTGPCAGRSITGSEVMYRSEPGFHGRDHVAWHVVYGNGRSGDTTVSIIVH